MLPVVSIEAIVTVLILTIVIVAVHMYVVQRQLKNTIDRLKEANRRVEDLQEMRKEYLSIMRSAQIDTDLQNALARHGHISPAKPAVSRVTAVR